MGAASLVWRCFNYVLMSTHKRSLSLLSVLLSVPSLFSRSPQGSMLQSCAYQFGVNCLPARVVAVCAVNVKVKWWVKRKRLKQKYKTTTKMKAKGKADKQ